MLFSSARLNKYWDACCLLLRSAHEANYFFKDFRLATIVLLDKVEGDPSLLKKRPLFMLEELLKLDDLAQEHRYESLAEKYGLLDEAQYGFVHGMGGTDVPIFITTQLIEHANISKTELHILFMDQHHAFDALEPLTGKLLASLRMGIPT